MYRNKTEFCVLLISSNFAELISSKHTQKHTNGIEVQKNCVCCILGAYLKKHYSYESSVLSQNIV